MKLTFLTAGALSLLLGGCATHPTNVQDVEPAISEEAQRQAQTALIESEKNQSLALKRKIAVGKLTNETTYGKSLIGYNSGDELGKKVSDMFVQSLNNSGHYLIFERPGLDLIENEAKLTGATTNLIGVDTLVMGSLTQFGRATTGESGFLSSSKKQEATATVNLRLVDTRTAQVFATVTGTGSSATESASTMGFGSVASYDGSLNDRAIGAAVNAAVEKLSKIVLSKLWSADVIAVENEQVFISGGKHQGIRPGMSFDVFTKGKLVKSTTTGGSIRLPGKKIAVLTINGSFGDTEFEEGSFGLITEGSIDSAELSNLEAREQQQ